MSTIPDFIGTELKTDGQIILTPVQWYDAPTYKRVRLPDEDQRKQQEVQLAQTERALSVINEDDFNLQRMCAPECAAHAVDSNTGSQVISLYAGFAMDAISIGCRTALYLMPKGASFAFEIYQDYFPEQDINTQEFYNPVLSYENINNWQEKKCDRYDKDTDTYTDAFGTQTKYECFQEVKPLDWRQIAFYDIVHYKEITFAAKKADAENYLLYTEHDPGPGFVHHFALHVVDITAGTHNTIKGMHRRWDEKGLPDLSAIGVDTNNYQETEVEQLSQDICQSVYSYAGGKQYLSAANQHRAVFNLMDKLKNV